MVHRPLEENRVGLRRHPTLRRQAARRAAEQGLQEHRQKLRKHASDRKLRQKLRCQLRQTFVKVQKGIRGPQQHLDARGDEWSGSSDIGG